jgi:hypothetical protein
MQLFKIRGLFRRAPVLVIPIRPSRSNLAPAANPTAAHSSQVAADAHALAAETPVVGPPRLA